MIYYRKQICRAVMTCLTVLWIWLPDVAAGKSVFTVDTMTCTVNLELAENAHLKVLPELILQNYFLGHFKAYYPKRELNEILPDDLLEHYGKANFQCGNDFCWQDYAGHPYLQEMYDKFKKQLRYREVIYYDAAHAVVKREIAWIQLVYSEVNYNGELQSFPGPKFWMFELYADPALRVPNPMNPSMTLSLRQEFDARHFVPNEIGQEGSPQKSKKYDNAEEH